ncbi:endonuclease/exonuclease/phosphatase family protein [Actinomycetota bacterium]
MPETRPALSTPRLVLAILALVLGLACAAAALASLKIFADPLHDAVLGAIAPATVLGGILLGAYAALSLRGPARLPGALVALLAAYPLALQAPSLVPHGRSEPEVRVMAFNTWFGLGDLGVAAREAAARDVDVVALLECAGRCVHDARRLFRPGGYSQVGVSGGAGNSKVHGTVLLARDGVDVTAHQVPEPRKGRIGYGASQARVVKGETSFRLVTLHFTNPLTTPPQWALDQGRAAEIALADEPVLMVGDLNTTPWHARYRWLLDEGRVHSCESDLGTGLQGTWGLASVPWLLQVDHALVRGLTCADQQHISIPGSDHRAVVTGVSAGYR